MRLVALSSTTRAPLTRRGDAARRRGAGVPATPRREGQLEPERGALAGALITAELPAHELDELAADREAEPGAAELARRRGVGLGERAEQPLAGR